MDRTTPSPALRALPWLYAIAGCCLLALALGAQELPDPAWRIGVASAGLGAAVVARIHNGFSWFLVAVMSIVGVRIALRVYDGAPETGVSWEHSVAGILTSALAIAALGVILVRRQQRIRLVDVVDVLAIVLGTILVGWMLLIDPLVERSGLGLRDAVLAVSFLPAPFLIVTFSADLWMSGLTRNRSMQLVNGAAWLAAGGSVVQALGYLDIDIPAGTTISAACFAAAFLVLCAAVTHPDAPGILAPRPAGVDVASDSSCRLLLVGISVLAPLALFAWLSPTATTDHPVRVIGTLLIVATVVARLYLTSRAHRTTRAALQRQLHRDELTGLPTRHRFVEEVAEALELTWRTERHPAIVKLNLDRFKQINDSLGREDANAVLRAVAGRLEEATESFGGFVARAGGDDFVVVDVDARDGTDGIGRAETIRRALLAPIHIGEATVFVTASIGVALAPHHRTITAEELMRRADIAAHEAKRAGRDQVAMFDESMHAQLAERVDVEQALHGAVGRHEMHLYHQPIVDITTGRVCGFEALIRWRRGDEVVPPIAFIPVAEETGMICELGAWALTEALTQLRGWIADGVVGPTTTMSVNVSPRQIADPTFPDTVRDALDASGISPHLVWIEMTESMMLQEPELAKTSLRKIRSMGVRLALDDFGTGYSSLSLLQQFPIQRIKIDRAFVQGIAERSNDRSLVRTIVAMAQSMGLDLVAEGVETVPQLEGLRELGCDKAQGYLISRPVPVDTIRSTMVALEDLTSLPLFGGDESTPGTLVTAAPARSANGHETELTTASPARPLGNVTSPLGQPGLRQLI
jgi:diguanylate cyclase (GGDEF)-like protein